LKIYGKAYLVVHWKVVEKKYSYLFHVTNQTHEHITTSVKIKGEATYDLST